MLRLARVRCLRPTATRHASYLLGIETSCDDTAAAVLDQDGRVLSNVISSQWELNAKWRGIVPALAARAHEENLPHVINAAIEQSGLESLQQLSAVAVTSGPGLAPCLDVGLRTARQICLDNPDIAFLQINHLEAHVLVSRLPQLETPRPEFPFVVLLVSGGHCCLVLAKSLGDYELLGNTLDDSIGEAYDKVARMLDITASGGKGVHGGKLIEDMAARGDDRAFPFTEPMKHRKDCDFSYSGIKTAMLREVKKVGGTTVMFHFFFSALIVISIAWRIRRKDEGGLVCFFPAKSSRPVDNSNATSVSMEQRPLGGSYHQPRCMRRCGIQSVSPRSHADSSRRRRGGSRISAGQILH
ncbi:hypothetical protein, variant 1 [Phytophthora nicotianae P1569]|uniref:N(6)-L-threonylcarbamoyladenine synthase n=1 Tax=Phytophthora nicotianae P1569 TaxID=1317065 RepID=V9E0B9_PHYNI|nr:hypothetical protein, variant 1 [Phytophthora nicotianae P1569]